MAELTHQLQFSNGSGYQPCSREYFETRQLVDSFTNVERSGPRRGEFRELLLQLDAMQMSGKHVGSPVLYAR